MKRTVEIRQPTEEGLMTLRTLTLTIATAMGLLASVAAAQEVSIGTGPVCDTQKQAERLVALLEQGSEAAVSAVNAEEKDPMACVVATVAFVEGPLVATVRNTTTSYKIFKILVLGLYTPTGVFPTAPASYFSILKIEERGA